ncbi:MAG: glutamine-hydrolyzing carbamoyl-phosphate synthase small subunit [Bacteroidales bacterium]|nr:glutamine-hydrolyzing carbamoyl-phosphate synthase small subunit [Bacteroidales bacterium]
MTNVKKATLILEDGTKFKGYSFGADKSCSGEVVFNTGMTGYPESLTDPSYLGQIIVSTYPIVGNYGVPSREVGTDGMSVYLESEKIHPEAIVCQDYSWDYSHWQAASSLSQWLKEEQVVGICGIDTRALTKLLREKGSMLGKIVVEDCADVDFYDPNKENLVGKASCTEVMEYGVDNEKKVVLIDCGVKDNIIRCLVQRGAHVIRVPWDYDFTGIDYDGLFISNGPGNPDFAEATVANIKKAFEIGKPICGICMGNQLLSKAAGAKVYKLKYGHRSHNQPVREVGTERCFVTSQNHGFAVDTATLGTDWEPYFVNMNDGTNEGIRHKSKPFFSTQFHPEACGGPTDTEFVFDIFMDSLK